MSSYTSKKFGADEYQVVQEWPLHKHDTSSVDDLKRYQGDQIMQKMIRLKLIQAIAQRRKCLSFLQKTDTTRYNRIMEKLTL